jgi:hypothetical protein
VDGACGNPLQAGRRVDGAGRDAGLDHARPICWPFLLLGMPHDGRPLMPTQLALGDRRPWPGKRNLNPACRTGVCQCPKGHTACISPNHLGGAFLCWTPRGRPASSPKATPARIGLRLLPNPEPSASTAFDKVGVSNLDCTRQRLFAHA